MLRFGLLLALFAFCSSAADRNTPEARAVAYLVREVPAWSRENGCFSCHHNGDGVRALRMALSAGYRVPDNALADSIAWLLRPERWDDNKGDPAFSDKRLANLQFAAALQSVRPDAKVALGTAAGRVAKDQGTEGAWEIEPGNPVGSPVTYGTPLATYMALRTLSDSANTNVLRKAWAWLEGLEPKNNVSAAALLLASRLEPNGLGTQSALQQLTGSQNSDGGWGPFAQSPSEPFDTALALLALKELAKPSRLVRARQFLIGRQNTNGSWPATTRPPGGDSYAQQVSTTAWALMALLETTNSANLKRQRDD